MKAPRIEVGPPKLLTIAGVLLVYVYGLLLFIPFLVAVLLISSVKFGFLTWMILLAVVVITVYLLPFAQGNARVVRLVRTLNASAAQSEDRFIVQVTFSPRLRSGVRALLEDADDIGCLSFCDAELVFRGDSVNLSVPFEQIREIRPQSVGLRGLYGARIALDISGLPGVESLAFSERSSWTLPNSRRTTLKMYERLASKVTTR